MWMDELLENMKIMWMTNWTKVARNTEIWNKL